jgi:hypothetical protein
MSRATLFLDSNCALSKAYSSERAWKAIRDSSRRPWYLNWFDHARKIRDRNQRTDIGNYSFVNRTIKNWNKIPAEALGLSFVNLKFLETDLGEQLQTGEMKGIAVWRKSSESAVK